MIFGIGIHNMCINLPTTHLMKSSTRVPYSSASAIPFRYITTQKVTHQFSVEFLIFPMNQCDDNGRESFFVGSSIRSNPVLNKRTSNEFYVGIRYSYSCFNSFSNFSLYYLGFALIAT